MINVEERTTPIGIKAPIVRDCRKSGVRACQSFFRFLIKLLTADRRK